jgi:2-polyprenyl-3-methyl-5-hydroxy-6-metoxy-1,4-benzoquinol methylase
MPPPFPDKSNGYEQYANIFMRSRSPVVGVATMREWSRSLPAGCDVLDLGCGSGVPVSRVLIEEGHAVYGVDASVTLIATFRERFPTMHTECAAVEDSTFFDRTFDAVIAWGLMFLLHADSQKALISKVAAAMNPGGTFLFTSPRDPLSWNDVMTERPSVSLGLPEYERLLRAHGLLLTGERYDEGENHYYLVAKPKMLED